MKSAGLELTSKETALLFKIMASLYNIKALKKGHAKLITKCFDQLNSGAPIQRDQVTLLLGYSIHFLENKTNITAEEFELLSSVCGKMADFLEK